MRIAIIGAGIIGLSLARQILKSHQNINVTVIDRFSIPSQGTSIRNSGVLHAGLYYEPDSLKARLCSRGRILLNEYISNNDLPINKCGKLLVPHSNQDLTNLSAIKLRADQNGCQTTFIDYNKAVQIQPHICRRESYLWSPNTFVFSPHSVLYSIASELSSDSRFTALTARVDRLSSESPSLYVDNIGFLQYDYVFNVAGPEALRLFKSTSSSLDHLRLVPFIGEYGVLKRGPEITTNLYPVPNPDLPFLGVHVTPRTGSLIPILGPNALPFHKSYINNYLSSDYVELIPRALTLSAMYLDNSSNFRQHVHDEFSLSKLNKFRTNTLRFFGELIHKNIQVSMCPDVYGIRPQLIDRMTLATVNDFICVQNSHSCHVVNAVSPAFTSAFAFAEHLVENYLSL